MVAYTFGTHAPSAYTYAQAQEPFWETDESSSVSDLIKLI